MDATQVIAIKLSINQMLSYCPMLIRSYVQPIQMAVAYSRPPIENPSI